MESAAHDHRVARHYDEETESFYLRYWDSEDIHFGLFAHDEVDFKPALKNMTRAAIDPARPSAEHLVVDAGCGVGGPAFDIARWYGCRVAGVTISHRQIAIAEARAQELGLTQLVTFAYADCSQYLPFADASVDIVLSIQSACHFSDRFRFLAECGRILKPGAALMLCDWMAADDITPESYRAFLDPVCACWLLAGLETRSTYAAMLAETGFEIREFSDLSVAAARNADILTRLYLDMLLQEASDRRSNPDRSLWKERFGTLAHAWQPGHFTIGRFAAQRQ